MTRLALLTIALAAGLVLVAPAQAAVWHAVDRHTDIDRTPGWFTSAYLSGGDEYDEPSVQAARVRITAPAGRVRYQVSQRCHSADYSLSSSREYGSRRYTTTRRVTRVFALPGKLIAGGSCHWSVSVYARPGTLRAALEVLS
jgi:hypothetical protein